MRRVGEVSRPDAHVHETPKLPSQTGAKPPVHPDLAPTSVLPKPHELPPLPVWGIPMNERNKDGIHSDFKKMADVFSGLKQQLNSGDPSHTTAESIKNFLKDNWAKETTQYCQSVQNSKHYRESDWWRSEDRNAVVRWIGSVLGRDQFAKDVDGVASAPKELAELAKAKIRDIEYREQVQRRTEDWNRSLRGAQGTKAPSFDELKTILSQKNRGNYAEIEPKIVAAARDGTLTYDQLGELSRIALRNGNVVESMLLSRIERNLERE